MDSKPHLWTSLRQRSSSQPCTSSLCKSTSVSQKGHLFVSHGRISYCLTRENTLIRHFFTYSPYKGRYLSKCAPQVIKKLTQARHLTLPRCLSQSITSPHCATQSWTDISAYQWIHLSWELTSSSSSTSSRHLTLVALTTLSGHCHIIWNSMEDHLVLSIPILHCIHFSDHSVLPHHTSA